MTEQSTPYTELPNYLVDEDYLAKMSGLALKCYVIINRIVVGFNRASWSIDSAFLLRKSGIKKQHTLIKALAELEQLGLVKIVPIAGRPHEFSITNPCQLGGGVKVSTHANKGHTTPTQERHDPHAVYGHDTHATERHTKKQTIRNKQIERKQQKEIREETTAFVPQNRPVLNFIEYHTEDLKFYSLKDLAQTYAVQADFTAQARVSFPHLTEQQIKNEFDALCQWSLTVEKRSSQKWMSAWLKFLKNPIAEKPKAPQKLNQRNVNDAWGEPKKYAPVTEGKA